GAACPRRVAPWTARVTTWLSPSPVGVIVIWTETGSAETSRLSAGILAPRLLVGRARRGRRTVRALGRRPNVLDRVAADLADVEVPTATDRYSLRRAHHGTAVTIGVSNGDPEGLGVGFGEAF